MTLLTFGLSAAALVVLALGFVLPPLLRQGEGGPAPWNEPRALRTAAVILLALPLTAAGLHALLGMRDGLTAGPHTVAAPSVSDIPAPVERTSPDGTSPASPAIGPAQIQAMVQRLSERLRQQPDDVDGWRMLARSSETLGRLDDAVRAYRQLERLRPGDAAVLTDQAVALAMTLDQQLSGEPERLIRRALAIDPGNVQALALAGSAAYERGEHLAAVAEWRKILATVPADDPMAATIRDSIRKAQDGAARRRAAAAGGAR